MFVFTNQMSRIFTPEPPFYFKIDRYEQGRQFEEYVISLFNRQFFHLIEWRKSREISDPALRTNYSYPDLELNFGNYNNYRFAVECKWRKDMRSLSIWWAKRDKVYTYQAFETFYDIPVFIAIEIGGKPSKPEALFVVPLYYFRPNQRIEEIKLQKFRRNPLRRFYYDPNQLMLF